MHQLDFMPAILLALVFFCPATYAQDNWPAIALPKNVTAFSAGDQFTANGLPMRVQGFVSKAKPAELLSWFRQSLGQPLVENTYGNKHILGRAQGQYYLTVQIEEIGRESKGVVAVSDIKSMAKNKQITQESRAKWLNRLPSNSKIVSQMSSSDGGNLSNQIVVVNTHSEILNRDALVAIMRDDGYQLKNESASDNKMLLQSAAHIRNSKVLIFSGNGKEATATIHRNEYGDTSVVLNAITQMERFK